jgi:hypothetical protein
MSQVRGEKLLPEKKKPRGVPGVSGDPPMPLDPERRNLSEKVLFF